MELSKLMKRKMFRSIVKAIKSIDEISIVPTDLETSTVERLRISRANLINILFLNGYELQQYTYKLIKSKHQRPLVEV